MLQEDCNNYIASVYFGVGGVGICFADITTGEILATDMSGEEMTIYTMNEIGRFTPKEVLLNPAAADDGALVDFLHEHMDSGLERMTEEQYDYAACEQLVRRQVCRSAEPTIFTDHSMIVCAVGALLRYLVDTQQSDLSNLDTLQLYYQGQYLELDLNARRNLELFETMRTKEKRGSLLWVLDHTKTAMGARMLRQWMSKPLRSPNQIAQRQKAVGELKDDLVRRTALADELRQMFDIERLIGRVVYGTANCRDMRSMFATLEHVPEIASSWHSASPRCCRYCASRWMSCRILSSSLTRRL